MSHLAANLEAYLSGDPPSEIVAEAIKSRTISLEADEWQQIVPKACELLKNLINEPAKASLVERLPITLTLMSLVGDDTPLSMADKAQIAVILGKLSVKLSNNRQMQKGIVDILLSWSKKEWLADTNNGLRNLLGVLLDEYNRTQKPADAKRICQLTNIAASLVEGVLNTTNINAGAAQTQPQMLANRVLDFAAKVAVYQIPEGRRFSSRMFESSCRQMHEKIKDDISANGANKRIGKALGELYYRCLTTLKDAVRQEFVQNCLQDLAYSSLLLSDATTADSLLEALEYFNGQARLTDSGVEALYDAYSPFILRLSDAPNCVVRCRAIQLLASAFPLSSPTLSKDETNKLMTRQLDVFEHALQDDVPSTRACALSSLCKIAGTAAELLPAGWLTRVLNQQIFQRLLYDATSQEVRLAAVRGIAQLLDNHVLWPLAEKLFSAGKNCLHDKSLQVRQAFVRLIEKVSRLHPFDWLKHVQIDLVLRRMAIDVPSVCRPLAGVILHTYMPKNKGAMEWLDICIQFVKSNRPAAVNFYREAITDVSFVHATAFVEMLFRYLKISTDKILKSNHNTTIASSNSSPESSPVKAPQVDAKVTESIFGMLDIGVVCWLALLPQLRQEHNAVICRDLEKRSAEALQALHRLTELCPQSEDVASTITLMASCLPWRRVESIFQRTVGTLRRSSAAEGTNTASTAVAIRALTNWSKLSELLHVILESVRESKQKLKEAVAAINGKDSKAMDESMASKAGRKRVRFTQKKAASSTAVGSASAAALKSMADLDTQLNYLDSLLSNRSCVRQLRDKAPQLRELFEEFRSTLDSTEQLFGATIAPENNCHEGTIRLLIDCFRFYCRLGLFLAIDWTSESVAVDDSFLAQVSDWLHNRAHALREMPKRRAAANRPSSATSSRSQSPLQHGQNVLRDIQVGLVRAYFNELATRLVLEDDAASLDNNTPTSPLTLALQDLSSVPPSNRCSLASSAVGLVYASILRHGVNGKALSIQDRLEYLNLLGDFISAASDLEEERMSSQSQSQDSEKDKENNAAANHETKTQATAYLISSATECLGLLTVAADNEEGAEDLDEIGRCELACLNNLISLTLAAVDDTEVAAPPPTFAAFFSVVLNGRRPNCLLKMGLATLATHFSPGHGKLLRPGIVNVWLQSLGLLQEDQPSEFTRLQPASTTSSQV